MEKSSGENGLPFFHSAKDKFSCQRGRIDHAGDQIRDKFGTQLTFSTFGSPASGKYLYRCLPAVLLSRKWLRIPYLFARAFIMGKALFHCREK
jgi:hypothetical protein